MVTAGWWSVREARSGHGPCVFCAPVSRLERVLSNLTTGAYAYEHNEQNDVAERADAAVAGLGEALDDRRDGNAEGISERGA